MKDITDFAGKTEKHDCPKCSNKYAIIILICDNCGFKARNKKDAENHQC